MAKWISVDEKLPEMERGEDCFRPNSYVIFADSEGKVFAASYSHQNKCFWYRDSLHPLNNITHWMPFPAHPAERKNNG